MAGVTVHPQVVRGNATVPSPFVKVYSVAPSAVITFAATVRPVTVKAGVTLSVTAVVGHASFPYPFVHGLAPVLKLEMAQTQPFVASPTWTDVSAYIELGSGISWTRGRSDPLSLASAGTSSWTFANDDGRFTPGNASSPYYPNVKLNRAFRLSATWGNVTYRMFYHFNDPWQVALEGGFRPYADMTATDRFKLLARKTLTRLYVEELEQDNPAGVYMLGEAPDAATGSLNNLDTSSQGYPSAIYPREFGALWSYGNQGPFPDASTSLELQADGGQNGSMLPYLPGVFTGPFSVEVWARMPKVNTQGKANFGYLWAAQGPKGAINGAYIYQRLQDGRLQIGIATPTSLTHIDPKAMTWAAGISSHNYADGNWHHVVGVFSAVTGGGSNAKLYVDGALVATATTTKTVPWYSTPGGYSAIGGSPVWPRYPIMVFVAGLAMYPGTALTAARVLSHYNVGKTLGKGELSGARIKRLLDYSMTPFVARTYTHAFAEALDAGLTTMDVQDTTDQTAMDAVSLAVQSEQGLLFVRGDGTTTFIDRESFWSPAVAFTLTAKQIDPSFAIIMDDTLLVNTCTATRTNSSTFVARNYASQDEYGVYADAVPDVPITDELLADFASYRVSKYATPAPRSYSIVVTPSVSPSLWIPMLLCEPGQRFTVSGLPATLNSTLDLVVQSVSHNVTPERWQVTIVGAPTDPDKYATWDSTVATWDGTSLWGW